MNKTTKAEREKLRGYARRLIERDGASTGAAIQALMARAQVSKGRANTAVAGAMRKIRRNQ